MATKEMRNLPTVRIVNPKDDKTIRIINEVDFDPKIHTLAESPEPVSAQAEAEVVLKNAKVILKEAKLVAEADKVAADNTMKAATEIMETGKTMMKDATAMMEQMKLAGQAPPAEPASVIREKEIKPEKGKQGRKGLQ